VHAKKANIRKYGLIVIACEQALLVSRKEERKGEKGLQKKKLTPLSILSWCVHKWTEYTTR